MIIHHMIKVDKGACTCKQFCEMLEIDRFLFYSYIREINSYYAEMDMLLGEYNFQEIKYDHVLKKYILTSEE